MRGWGFWENGLRKNARRGVAGAEAGGDGLTKEKGRRFYGLGTVEKWLEMEVEVEYGWGQDGIR